MAVPFATPSFSSSDPILLSPPTHPALPSPNPDASAFASQARLGKLPSTEDTSASRSASLRRKPVPALLPMPNMHLPATHPFAAPSPKPGKTGDDSPASPGSARMDADLFFSPPARGTLPPPPRRAGMSPVLSAVRGKNEGGGDEMEILRVGGQVEEIVLGERVKRSPLPTPRSSPYDRPLPDLPVEAEHISPSLQESNTEDSMTELTTPRAPATYPAAAIKGESWDLADEVAFQDRMSAKPISSANLFSKSTVNKEKDKEKGKAKAIRVPLLPGGEAAEDETFSVDRIPSKRRLWEAGTCFLRDEQGQLVCFGDLFPRWDDGQEGQVLRNNAKGKPPLPSDPPTPTRPHPQQPPAHFGQSQSPPHTKQLTAADSSSLKKRTPRTVVFFIRHFWCGQCQDYTFASLSLLDPAAVAAAGIRVVIISNGSWKIIKSYRKLFNCPFPIYVDGPRRLYSLLGWALRAFFLDGGLELMLCVAAVV